MSAADASASLGAVIDFSTQDFVALRSGPGTTPQYSGGGTSFQSVSPQANVTYFSGGEQPAAYKGVAITFGPDKIDRAAQVFMEKAAVTFINDHFDDHVLYGDTWNRSPFGGFG